MRGIKGKNIKAKAKHIKRFVFALTVFVILAFIMFGVFEAKLSKVVSGMAENIVKSRAAIIINNAIYEEVENDDITYDRLVSFEKDGLGRITALKTNIIEINRLKSKLAVKILDELTDMDNTEIEIPIGTVLGTELLSGKGPGIKVSVIPVGAVETEIENEISSAGINQSRHQILMKVKADITVITALSGLSTTVESYVCIAETVIVGDVPGSYTNINTKGQN